MDIEFGDELPQEPTDWKAEYMKPGGEFDQWKASGQPF
jgi:hypothetical protein